MFNKKNKDEKSKEEARAIVDSLLRAVGGDEMVEDFKKFEKQMEETLGKVVKDAEKELAETIFDRKLNFHIKKEEGSEGLSCEFEGSPAMLEFALIQLFHKDNRIFEPIKNAVKKMEEEHAPCLED